MGTQRKGDWRQPFHTFSLLKDCNFKRVSGNFYLEKNMLKKKAPPMWYLIRALYLQASEVNSGFWLWRYVSCELPQDGHCRVKTDSKRRGRIECLPRRVYSALDIIPKRLYSKNIFLNVWNNLIRDSISQNAASTLCPTVIFSKAFKQEILSLQNRKHSEPRQLLEGYSLLTPRSQCSLLHWKRCKI